MREMNLIDGPYRSVSVCLERLVLISVRKAPVKTAQDEERRQQIGGPELLENFKKPFSRRWVCPKSASSHQPLLKTTLFHDAHPKNSRALCHAPQMLSPLFATHPLRPVTPFVATTPESPNF